MEKRNHGLKCFAIILSAGLICILLYLTYQCSVPYENLRENVFRLHILANSDDMGDQQLKLLVRDDILPLAKKLFDGMHVMAYDGETYAEKTANAAKSRIGALQTAAQQSVYAHGSTQTAAVSVGYEAFPEKQYADLTMPAGDYWCLRIVLGSGKGHNWWCVLYPPLCLTPAAAKDCFEESELAILQQPDRYRFRLAVVEWFQKWQQRQK